MINLPTQEEKDFLRESSSYFKSRSFHHPSSSSSNNRHHESESNYTYRQQQHAAETEDTKEGFSTAISWPIILAIIPTLGTFIAGSAESWSDFIMILLILYYVYKWITVPWSYYESARSRRLIRQYDAPNPHQYHHQQQDDDRKRKEYVSLHKASAEEELRRHELIGLAWVVVSPAIAGYTLQYSRYFLSNYDKYMSTFNVTVFVLAATLKPLFHVIALLRERTLFLQSEMQVDENEIDQLQKKVEMMENELEGLRKAFVTKRDLGKATQDMSPNFQQLARAIKRFEKRETTLRSWSEDRFTKMDQKMQDFDQFIRYSIEQDQRNSGQRVLVTLMFLPMKLTYWAAKRMTGLLPIPRALLNLTGARSPATITAMPSAFNRPSRHLTHISEPMSSPAPVTNTTRQRLRENTNTTVNDPSETSYSAE